MQDRRSPLGKLGGRRVLKILGGKVRETGIIYFASQAWRGEVACRVGGCKVRLRVGQQKALSRPRYTFVCLLKRRSSSIVAGHC